MCDFKYKGIDLKAIKDVQIKFEPYRKDNIVFKKEILLKNLNENENMFPEILKAIESKERQELEATEMYCICEMARLWLKHCRDMEEIVERLEEQAEECRKYWNEFDDEDSFGGMNAYCDAIEIVKEVGGMND